MKRKLMVVSLLLIVIIVSGCNLFTKKGSLSGKVTDEFFQPIKDALISIDGKTFATDAKGKYIATEIKATTQKVTVIADGYQKKEEMVEIKKDGTGELDFKLALSGNLAKQMVTNYSNSMYRLGTIAVCEESIIRDHFEKKLYPFYEDMGEYMAELISGLTHTQILEYAPGIYTSVVDPEWGSIHYTLETPGSSTEDSLEWKVNDDNNGVIVTIVATNFERRMDDDSENSMTIDLTNSLFTYTIESTDNPDATYSASLEIGDQNSHIVSIIEPIDEYTTNFIVPSGPTAAIEVVFNPEQDNSNDDITVSGSFNLPQVIDELTLSLEGSIISSVARFDGYINFSMTAEEGVVDFYSPMNIQGNGTFEFPDYYEISGGFDLNLAWLKYNDSDRDDTRINYSMELIIEYLQFDAGYKSDSTEFDGSIIYKVTNLGDFQGSEYFIPVRDLTLEGTLAYVDGDIYSVDVDYVYSSEEHTDMFSFMIAKNEITLNGDIAFNYETRIASVNVLDRNGSTLELECGDTSANGEEVGQILSADGSKLATIKKIIPTNISETPYLTVNYTEGEFDILYLDFNQYFKLDSI